MTRQSIRQTKLICAAALLLFPAPPIFPQEPEPNKEKKEKKEKREKKEPPVSVTSLRIEVTSGDPAVPVEGADVYVKAEAPDTTFQQAVRTNSRGLANLPGVPRGTVLVQVTAPGCETYGHRFELTKEKEIKQVKLERSPN
jgi:Carboxypeptidase regulatory-like domain